ncbi:MAG: hypothetical protein LBP85_01615 [Prevotellaceae bacterium]|jgi:hypothetical protein|nr:hypothetical protein [Prevotellaceae bacterium]
MKVKTKNQKTDKKLQAQQVAARPFNWIKFSVKILLLFVITVCAVKLTDNKNYFRADQTNNHIERKWKSFYNFTKTKNVDILLCGNSHIITGIDPFVLSCAMGCNCFILDSPGVSIPDTYFVLGEALEITKPKLVVIETYALNSNNDKDNGGMYQIMSFEAVQNFWHKLKMMPQLFNSNSWVKAWSPTVRNHSFLLTNRKQIGFNLKNPKLKNEPQRLDLGRFARFDKGLQPETLAKYDSLGAVVDGGRFEVSNRNKTYLKKIMNLCKEKKIPVLFLTIPMYYKHISDYEHWQKTLGEELKKYPQAQWIDWQMPYDTAFFTPEAFENTYSTNQHLSNFGMEIAAYRLAEALQKNYAGIFPDRSAEKVWLSDFYSQPHFIYNQPAPAIAANCEQIAKNVKINGLLIKEMLVQQYQDFNHLILKTEKYADSPPVLNAVLKLQFQNQTITAPVQMTKNSRVLPPQHDVYFATIKKDVKIVEIVGF